MPLTRKRATIWTCSDGTEHTDFVAAAEHEQELDLRKHLNALLDPNSADGDISVETVVDILITQRKTLAKLFSKSRTTFRREAVPADRETGKS